MRFNHLTFCICCEMYFSIYCATQTEKSDENFSVDWICLVGDSSPIIAVSLMYLRDSEHFGGPNTDWGAVCRGCEQKCLFLFCLSLNVARPFTVHNVSWRVWSVSNHNCWRERIWRMYCRCLNGGLLHACYLQIYNIDTVSVAPFSLALTWLFSAPCVQKQENSTETAKNVIPPFFPLFFLISIERCLRPPSFSSIASTRSWKRAIDHVTWMENVCVCVSPPRPDQNSSLQLQSVWAKSVH